MGLLCLPPELPTWVQVRSYLVDLYDELSNRNIGLQDVGWLLQVIHNAVQSGSSRETDGRRLKGFEDDDDGGSRKVLDGSSPWYNVVQFLQAINTEKQDHFLYFTLPGIIQSVIALEDVSEEEKVAWCQQCQDSRLVLTRQFTCSIVASLFLQLYPQHHEFASVFKEVSTPGENWKLQSVLDYFDKILTDSLDVRGHIAIQRKTLALRLPMTLEDLVHCDLDLCPLTLLSEYQEEEEEEETDKKLQVHFCTKSFESQETERGTWKESALLWLYPELLAVVVKAAGTHPHEAIVVSGLDTLGTDRTSGQEWSYQQECCPPDRVVLLDNPAGWCEGRVEGEAATDGAMDSLVLQVLNSALFGFSGQDLSCCIELIRESRLGDWTEKVLEESNSCVANLTAGPRGTGAEAAEPAANGSTKHSFPSSSGYHREHEEEEVGRLVWGGSGSKMKERQEEAEELSHPGQHKRQQHALHHHYHPPQQQLCGVLASEFIPTSQHHSPQPHSPQPHSPHPHSPHHPLEAPCQCSPRLTSPPMPPVSSSSSLSLSLSSSSVLSVSISSSGQSHPHQHTASPFLQHDTLPSLDPQCSSGRKSLPSPPPFDCHMVTSSSSSPPSSSLSPMPPMPPFLSHYSCDGHSLSVVSGASTIHAIPSSSSASISVAPTPIIASSPLPSSPSSSSPPKDLAWPPFSSSYSTTEGGRGRGEGGDSLRQSYRHSSCQSEGPHTHSAESDLSMLARKRDVSPSALLPRLQKHRTMEDEFLCDVLGNLPKTRSSVQHACSLRSSQSFDSSSSSSRFVHRPFPPRHFETECACSGVELSLPFIDDRSDADVTLTLPLPLSYLNDEMEAASLYPKSCDAPLSHFPPTTTTTRSGSSSSMRGGAGGGASPSSFSQQPVASSSALNYSQDEDYNTPTTTTTTIASSPLPSPESASTSRFEPISSSSSTAIAGASTTKLSSSTSSTTFILPPLRVDIPTIPSLARSFPVPSRAGRRSPREKSYSSSQDKQSPHPMHPTHLEPPLSSSPHPTQLEPPLSSSPHSSASSLNTSPNSSFVLPDSGFRQTRNLPEDVEVTADFFIHDLENPDHFTNPCLVGQELDCPSTLLHLPAGTNGAHKDFHSQLRDLISSSSSSSSSSGHSVVLGQCLPSSSGCSHWGSRSGSISSHGTNGSSNDFVEFWYNLRRRSSQLSDASRRSSSSKHSSDFSTDLEDISENFSKHSHEIIEEEGALVSLLTDFASNFVSTAIEMGTTNAATRVQQQTTTGESGDRGDNLPPDVLDSRCQMEDKEHSSGRGDLVNNDVDNSIGVLARQAETVGVSEGRVMEELGVDMTTTTTSSNISQIECRGDNKLRGIGETGRHPEQTPVGLGRSEPEEMEDSGEEISTILSGKREDEERAVLEPDHDDHQHKHPHRPQLSSQSLGREKTEPLHVSIVASGVLSPADSAFVSGTSSCLSLSATPHFLKTDAFRFSPAKEMAPSQASFSPPQREQTVDLKASLPPSFAVLESKVMYLEQPTVRPPKYASASSSSTTTLFSKIPSPVTTKEHIDKVKSPVNRGSAERHKDTTADAATNLQRVRSKPRQSHIPRSSSQKSPPSLSSSPVSAKEQPDKKSQPRKGHKTATTPSRSVLEVSKSHKASPSPSNNQTTATTTTCTSSLARQGGATAATPKVSNLPRHKSSPRSSWDNKPPSHQPKTTKAIVHSSTVAKPHKDKDSKQPQASSSPYHSPRSRYVFSDVAAPLDGVKTRSRRKSTTERDATRRNKTSSSTKRTSDRKGQTKEVKERRVAHVDIKKLPQFWRFVNSLAERMVSQAVLEGAGLTSTPRQSSDNNDDDDDNNDENDGGDAATDGDDGGGRVEELSDEVYNWFADKIVHQVFCRVLESMESKEENATKNGKKEKSILLPKDEPTIALTETLDSPTPTVSASSFGISQQQQDANNASPSILTRSNCISTSSQKSPSIPFPTTITTTTTSSLLSFPGLRYSIQKQKSISGRPSGLNKTVSFEDSNREPIRTGSEGDLSRQPAFPHHYSSSFGGTSNFFRRDRPSSSAWSVSSQEDASSSFTDFLSTSRRVPPSEASTTRIHRRWSKSTTDLPRWTSLTSVEYLGTGSPLGSRQNLRHAAEMKRGGNAAGTGSSPDASPRRGLSRSNEQLSPWRGSLTVVDPLLSSMIRDSSTSIDGGHITTTSGVGGGQSSTVATSLTNTDLCVDLYQAAVSIVNQVFLSISETVDIEALRAEDSLHNAAHPGPPGYSSDQYAVFSSNIFSSSVQKKTPSSSAHAASPKRSHRSVSPNVGVFSRKPMSRESLTNAFLKVDSQPSIQNYERRSSEPCHTSVQLSLEVFNKNRYNYKPTKEPVQTASTDDDIGRGGSSSSRISWRRSSFDTTFSFESHHHHRHRHNTMSGFKDPVLSRFAEELMKADTSVPELVLVGSSPSCSTTGSRRSSISGFRDTTLANLESELLNTSFTSINSLPMSQSPRSQAGLGQSKVRSKSRERYYLANRSDSSDAEHWFPPPRHVGEEFQLEFNRQHSQGQEEVRDFASIFAGCVVQEAVCVIQSDPNYQTDTEMAISLYAENLSDQILRDAFITSRGTSGIPGMAPSYYHYADNSQSDDNVCRSRSFSETRRPAMSSDSRYKVGGGGNRQDGGGGSLSAHCGEGARPKVKTQVSSSSPSICIVQRGGGGGRPVDHRKPTRRHHRHRGDSASSDGGGGGGGFGYESNASSQGEGSKKKSYPTYSSKFPPYRSDLSVSPAQSRLSTGAWLQSQAVVKAAGGGGGGGKEIFNVRSSASDCLSQSRPNATTTAAAAAAVQASLSVSSVVGSERRARTGRSGGGGSGGDSRTRTKQSRERGGGGDWHRSVSSEARSSPHLAVSHKRPEGTGTWSTDVSFSLDISDGFLRQDLSMSSSSSSPSSSSPSSLASEDTASSILSCDNSDDPSPRRISREEKKRKKFTRQNAVSSHHRQDPSQPTDMTGSGGGGRSSRGRLAHRGRERDRLRPSGSAGGHGGSGGGGGRPSLSSSMSRETGETFASRLSECLVSQALREVDSLPWWRRIPICQHRPLAAITDWPFHDPDKVQLYLATQWMAASLARCPHLVLAAHRHAGMELAERAVHLMSSWSVGALASAIREYTRTVHSQSTDHPPSSASAGGGDDTGDGTIISTVPSTHATPSPSPPSLHSSSSLSPPPLSPPSSPHCVDSPNEAPPPRDSAESPLDDEVKLSETRRCHLPPRLTLFQFLLGKNELNKSNAS